MKFANLKKIMSILTLIIVINCAIPLASGAKENSTNSENKYTGAGIEFNENDLSDIYNYSNHTYFGIGKKIIGVAQLICYTAALIILLYKGVQFMAKAPEAKAEMKKELVSYVIGASIMFAIGSIIKIIGNIAFKVF